MIIERPNLDVDERKLEKEDRRFLLNINHNELLFNESMLLQNRVLVIAIFALFVSLLALIIPSDCITVILKLLTITILSIFSLYLLILFCGAVKMVKAQNEKLKNNYDYLIKYHLKYAVKKVQK